MTKVPAFATLVSILNSTLREWGSSTVIMCEQRQLRANGARVERWAVAGASRRATHFFTLSGTTNFSCRSGAFIVKRLVPYSQPTWLMAPFTLQAKKLACLSLLQSAQYLSCVGTAVGSFQGSLRPSTSTSSKYTAPPASKLPGIWWLDSHQHGITV
jgi:hypothetical protein